MYKINTLHINFYVYGIFMHVSAPPVRISVIRHLSQKKKKNNKGGNCVNYCKGNCFPCVFLFWTSRLGKFEMMVMWGKNPVTMWHHDLWGRQLELRESMYGCEAVWIDSCSRWKNVMSHLSYWNNHVVGQPANSQHFVTIFIIKSIW